jgi:hypothetical protein
MIAALVLIGQTLIAPPDGVRRDLDAICKGWQLAPVTPETANEIRTRTPTWPPNLLPGDFNGDGQIDVAVLIECNGSSQLVAFMSSGSAFSQQVLEKPQPYDARSPDPQGIRARRHRRRVRSDRRTRVGVPRQSLGLSIAVAARARLSRRSPMAKADPSFRTGADRRRAGS